MAYVVGVFGSMGGAGKTTVATQLTHCFGHDFGAQALLIDANWPVSTHLKEYLRHTESSNFLDDGVSTEISAVHKAEEQPFYYACVYSGKDIAEGLERVIFLVKMCAARFDYIVIDFGSRLDEMSRMLLDICNIILLVSDSSAVGLARMKSDYEYLRNKNFAKDLLHAVINFADEREISEEWVKATLGLSSVHLAPELKGFKDGASISFEKIRDKKFVSLIRGIAALSEVATEFFDPEISVSKEDRLEYERKLKAHIHAQLVEIPELKRIEVESDDYDWDSEQFKRIEENVRREIIKLLDKSSFIRDRKYREKLVLSLLNEALRLGPLDDLLADEEISEIMVNSWDSVFVESKGVLSKTDIKFLSNAQLARIVERIVRPLGRRVDLSSPFVNARLQDGSRVNIIVPPLAVKGSAITIRKFSKDPLLMDDLVEYDSINRQVVEFLEASVISRLNMIISGGTGSGKTTLLNIISSFIPDDERIITIEDTAELQLRQPHVVALESRPPNVEGKGGFSIRDLVANALRMRPDRIVVGECREGEALDMLQAMNTGHDGSMTTLHANSTREMLSRLETLVMFAGTDLPSSAIKMQIAGALDLVVQIGRLKDGTRKVIQVSEVGDFDGNNIEFNDIFMFQQNTRTKEGKVVGEFRATGYLPKCLERFSANGINIPKEIFWRTQ